MISVHNIPALSLEHEQSRDIIEKIYKHADGIRKIIQDVLLHTCDRLHLHETTGKTLREDLSFISQLDFNSVYWPTGARRFGAALVVIDELAASAVFASSQQNRLLDQQGCSLDCPFTSSQCEPTEPPNPQFVADASKSPADAIFSVLGQANIADFSCKSITQSIAPVVVTFSTNIDPPTYGQSYAQFLMYPFMYIPLTQWEFMAFEKTARGFGIMVFVDQRFFWRFIKVRNQLLLGYSNKNYFDWHKLIYKVCAQYLYPWQWYYQAMSFDHKLIHDYIDYISTPLTPSPEERDPYPDTPIFLDDRAYLGPPVQFTSYGSAMTLSQVFDMIEWALDKKLVFSHIWKISFRNPQTARHLWLRNLAVFFPAITYHNDDIYYELNADKEQVPTIELPIMFGGLPVSCNRFHVKLDMGYVIVDKLVANLSPVTSMPLPQTLTVHGSLYITTNPLEIGTDNDWGTVFPHFATLGTVTIASSPNPPTDWKDFPLRHRDASTGSEFVSLNIPMLFRGPVVESTHIINTAYCVTAVEASFGTPDGEEDPPVTEGGGDTDPNATWGEPVDNGVGDGYFVFGLTRARAYAAAVARSFLGWSLSPFSVTLPGCFHWPFTGFEDFVIVRETSTSIVTHTQQQLIHSGVKYSGLDDPSLVMQMKKHPLLSNTHMHAEAYPNPEPGAVIVGDNVNAPMIGDLRPPYSIEDYDVQRGFRPPQDSKSVWVARFPYELTTSWIGAGRQMDYHDMNNTQVLTVVSLGGYTDSELSYFVDQWTYPNPSQVIAFIPFSKYGKARDTCTLVWWPPTYVVDYTDLYPHLLEYKFEQSVRMWSEWLPEEDRNPYCGDSPCLALWNDIDDCDGCWLVYTSIDSPPWKEFRQLILPGLVENAESELMDGYVHRDTAVLDEEPGNDAIFVAVLKDHLDPLVEPGERNGKPCGGSSPFLPRAIWCALEGECQDSKLVGKLPPPYRAVCQGYYCINGKCKETWIVPDDCQEYERFETEGDCEQSCQGGGGEDSGGGGGGGNGGEGDFSGGGGEGGGFDG